MYCNGDCAYLDEKKHRCKKYNARLGYVRNRGVVRLTAHEKDAKCIAAPRHLRASSPYVPGEDKTEATV